MRGLSVLALGALVAALALPAEAASPPKKEIARLKRRLTRSSAGGAVFGTTHNQWPQTRRIFPAATNQHSLWLGQ
jgi:hypothetical protein